MIFHAIYFQIKTFVYNSIAQGSFRKNLSSLQFIQTNMYN